MCSRDFAQRNLVMESTNARSSIQTLHRETYVQQFGHGKYPCAADHLHREASHGTPLQQGVCTEKPSHGKYPCAAKILHRET